jgi:DNA-binding MarR family transcriptional regulator
MRNISDREAANDTDRILGLLLAMGRLRSLRDPIAQTCETMQFTPPQIHSLLWLGTDGALTMGELARRNGITEKTVTGVVDRLERMVLVKRTRGEKDRRTVRAELTRRGEQMFEKIHGQVRQHFAQVLGLLDPSDRAVLLRTLEKLAEKLKVGTVSQATETSTP